MESCSRDEDFDFNEVKLDLEEFMDLMDKDDEDSNDINAGKKDSESSLTNESGVKEVMSKAPPLQINHCGSQSKPEAGVEEAINKEEIFTKLKEIERYKKELEGLLVKSTIKTPPQMVESVVKPNAKPATAGSSKSQAPSKETSAVRKDVTQALFGDNGLLMNTATTKLEGKIHESLIHSQNDDSDSNEENDMVSSHGDAKIKITQKPVYFERREPKDITSWNTKKVNESQKAAGTILQDNFSGLRIINPKHSSELLKEKMDGKKIIRLFVIENYLRRKDCDDESWVTFGVIVYKSEARKSQNGKMYSIWHLNDLRDCQKEVKFFLFGEVHNNLWKTQVGSVIGLLNPKAMDSAAQYKNSGVSITINHPQKVLILGTAKDFGTCKGRKQKGDPCNNVVNVSLCEFCVYHVQSQYKKMSGQRMELQASYSGVQPKSIKQQILKKNNIMYGGALYTVPLKQQVSQKLKEKDRVILASLKLQTEAKDIVKGLSKEKVNHLTQNENHAVNSIAGSTSDFLGNMLQLPSAGSRNLLKHYIKEENTPKTKGNQSFKSITPRELLKLHEMEMKDRIKKRAAESPCLGRGAQPGSDISLMGLPTTKAQFGMDPAKLRVLSKLKRPLEAEDPNSTNKKTKHTQEVLDKIQARVESDSKSKEDVPEQEVKNSISGKNYTKEEIKKIVDMKSTHQNEFDAEEEAQKEKYFMNLEKRELLEKKMESVMEIDCNVVSCKQCQYTAHQPSELCRKEGHKLTRHKAKKRFFACSNCKRRTNTFQKIPKHPCKNCGSSKFDRTSMAKPKSGPLLESETLLIRGEEKKFINS